MINGSDTFTHGWKTEKADRRCEEQTPHVQCVITALKPSMSRVADNDEHDWWAG